MPPLLRLREPFSRLFRTGTHAGMDPRAAKRLVLANQIAFSLAAICILHIYIDRALGVPQMGWFNIGMALGYGCVLLLSRAGLPWAARFGLVLFAACHILAYVLALGRDIGMHLFFLPACWAPLVLFGWHERRSLISGVGLHSVLLVACELLVGGEGFLRALDPALEARQHADNVITTLIIQILIAAYFFFGNHRAETALGRAAEAARSADQAKTRFLANMSHEIRTPLNGVLGITHLLIKSGLSREKLDMAQTIQSSSLDLMTILNEILDLSKIEAGKMELERRSFDLRRAVAAVLKPFEYEAGRKGLALALDMHPGVPAWVLGDSTRIRQVLRNLTGNALKFTSVGGVTLRIRPAGQEGALLFEVEDTGPGIPDEARGRIFQSFSQADESTTRKHGGTGLGLAICKQLVELMGGSIGFRNRDEGTGTVFHFAIPLPAAPEAGQAESGEDPAGGNEPVLHLEGLRVLIVDDHPVNRKVLAGMLEGHGIRPDLAANGQEALEASARYAYDLVFMDSHMPGMDGLECTRRLRTLAHGDQAPRVVGVTADVMAGSRERCLAAGMDEVLPKPILAEDLDRILAQVRPSSPRAAQAWSQAGEPQAMGAGDPEDGASAWVDAGRLRAIMRSIRRRKAGYWDEMLTSLERDLETQLRAARLALEQGDGTAAGEALHALKGLCLTMGLVRMGETCLALETSVAQGPATPSEWTAAYQSMEDALAPSMKVMRQIATRCEISQTA